MSRSVYRRKCTHDAARLGNAVNDLCLTFSTWEGESRRAGTRSRYTHGLNGSAGAPPSQKVLVLVCLLIITGCDRLDMYDQPRYEPLEASQFFGDGLSARPPIEGTVARGALRDDISYFTGKEDGKLVAQIPQAAYRAIYDRNPQRFDKSYDDVEPATLRRALLERGQERFNIYCSVCHARTGDGDGMIVRRGFRPPPSYHIDRLRQAANGHFYDVITNGFGAMARYSSQIDVADRWAIVAYIRALQLCHNAQLDDVPADQRDGLIKLQSSDEPQDASSEDVP